MCVLSQLYYSEFLLYFCLRIDGQLKHSRKYFVYLLLKEKHRRPIDSKYRYVLFCECILVRQASIE